MKNHHHPGPRSCIIKALKPDLASNDVRKKSEGFFGDLFDLIKKKARSRRKRKK